MFVPPRMEGRDGLRNVLAVGFPLILSNAVVALNLFLDRTFLAWHSADAFTASMQGGILTWMVLTVFLFTIGYATTFVAQYLGAGRLERIGAVIWQAIYLSLAGGVLLVLIAPLGWPLFRWIGHDEPLPELEAFYFQIVTAGGIFFLLQNALLAFYQGMGRTKLVLFVTAATCLINICLNVWLIFTPVWIFPDGIGGAAWATVLAWAAGTLIVLALLVAHPNVEKKYRLFSAWRYDGGLVRRILKFGFPSGLHGLVETSGFTIFLMVVGVFGYQAQFASNMAMNVNMLLFIPSVGMHIAAIILAGQLCGAKDILGAERMVFTVLMLCGLYSLAVCFLYIFTPDFFLVWFRGNMPEAEWQEMMHVARMLLIVVAVYTLFDAVGLVYSGALKGAGDTKWVMWAGLCISTFTLAIPSAVLIMLFRADFFADPRHAMMIAWALCCLYIVSLGTVYLLRFHNGHWRTIDVIEHQSLVDPLMSLEEVPLPGDLLDDSGEMEKSPG